MHKRLILAALTATGGLLTSAFLQAAVAMGDPVSASGVDAFTIGNYTFDPYLPADPDTGATVEGFLPVSQLVGAAPLLQLGGGAAVGINLAPQSFAVYDSTGLQLGSIDTNETVSSLFGLSNTEFTVLSTSTQTLTPVPGAGSVFDVFNLGNGYYNVYSAVPGGLDGDSTVTDTLITPNGDLDLTPLFGNIDVSAPLQPGLAFTDLQTDDPTFGAAAFNIGGFTLDPTQGIGLEGFTPVGSTVSIPPLLNIGGAEPLPGFFSAEQDFNVLGESQSDQIGVIYTGVQVTNLLGFTNTELIVTGGTDFGNPDTVLPTVGTVYDAFNLGNGYTNVYTAIPGVDGADDTVTDTLITPTGNIDLTPLFGNIDAAAPLDPGAAFTGLPAGDPSIGTDAFLLGGFTFDPTLAGGGEGFDPVTQLTGLPPLLIIGGGALNIQPGVPDGVVFNLAPQAFDVYDGTNQLASIDTSESVTQLLGLTNTEFTITGVNPVGDGTLPTVGSVYDVFNLGNGYANVYTAIPGLDGAPDTIHDTFVTPMGSMNLDALFGSINVLGSLDPGAAFAGLDAASDTAAAADPLAFLGL